MLVNKLLDLKLNKAGGSRLSTYQRYPSYNEAICEAKTLGSVKIKDASPGHYVEPLWPRSTSKVNVFVYALIRSATGQPVLIRVPMVGF